MSYIELREAELLKDRERLVKDQILRMKYVRAEIDTGFASGEEHPMVQYTGYPVGFVDEIVKELDSWYLAEPSQHGRIKLRVANDDRNNTDSIVASLE